MAKNIKADKAETNDDKEFPGYPHYPAKDDIMNVKDSKRVQVDIEDLSRSNLISSAAAADELVKMPETIASTDDDIKIVTGTEADVTSDDLILLKERDTEFGKSETLSGDDLDVPGAEEDDANEDIGEEDEENNYYSLGGDAYENLEEDKS